MKIELNNNIKYYLSPYGLGDTLFICRYIEEMHDNSICLIIKETHEFIVKEHHISNYILMRGGTTNDVLSFLRENQTNVVQVPTYGKIYVAHASYNNFNLFREIGSNSCDFVDFYYKYFGWKEKLLARKLNLSQFLLRDDIRYRIEQLKDTTIDNIVLCVPNSRTIPSMSRQYLSKLIDRINRENPQSKILFDTDIDMSLYDLISVALNVKHVYANKSGLCDILGKMENRLTAIYPNSQSLFIYSAKKMFGDSEVIEIIQENL